MKENLLEKLSADDTMHIDDGAISSAARANAQLHALAYDHALQLAAMRDGLMVVGGAMHFDGQTSYPVAIGKGGGLNTVLYPDDFGCLDIPAGEFGDRVRAALRAALGLK